MTARETIIAALIVQLKAAPGMPTVDRSLEVAYTREESPVLVVHRGMELPNYGQAGVVDRTCEVLISVIARGSNPEVDADDVLAISHPVVMGFVIPGVISVDETRTEEPRYSNVDQAGCMVTMRYAIKYRTQPNTL